MRSTACWSWDARSLSASPDPERGWGKCARTPDPCNTPPCADPDAGNLEAQVPQPDQPLGRAERAANLVAYIRASANGDQVGNALSGHVSAISQFPAGRSRQIGPRPPRRYTRAG